MWYRCSYVHNLTVIRTWRDWLRYCTWGRETTGSRSSVAALSLRSWSRRNWMSEAGVSRSWTHNSTAHSHFTNTLDKLHHILIDISLSFCLSLCKAVLDRQTKSQGFEHEMITLDYICSLQFPNSLSRTEKPQMRSDFRTSRKKLYLLLQRRRKFNLMLYIFFILQHQSFLIKWKHINLTGVVRTFWEIHFFTFLLKVRWKDWYHSHVGPLNWKLQPAAC